VITVQASQAGGIRLAPVRDGDAKGQQEGRRVSAGVQLLATTSLACDRDVNNTEHTVTVLMRELEFLENGGYRLALGWRPPLILEDSPICPKATSSACPNPECRLLDFVPKQRQDQTIPCRHIPLNEAGETLHTLYNRATSEEIEQVLLEWLHKVIAELKQAPHTPEA
jgi:hypothetical protein